MAKKMFVLLMVVMLIGASQNVLADRLVENVDVRSTKSDVFYIEVEVISADGVRSTGLSYPGVLSLSSPIAEIFRVHVQTEATMRKLGFSEMKLQRKLNMRRSLTLNYNIQLKTIVGLSVDDIFPCRTLVGEAV